MGTVERRQRERLELRARILEAAGQLFVEEGVANVSIRRIAEKIEYAPSTIYLYFKDKTELLETICSDTFEQLNECLRSLFKQDLSPLDRLRGGAQAYIEFGLAHPSHYLVTFCLPPNREIVHDKNSGKHRAGLEAFDLLRLCLRNGMDAGAIVGMDLELLSQNVWMFMHGVTSLLISKDGQNGFPWADRKALIDSGIEMIVRGVAAQPCPNPCRSIASVKVGQ